MSSDAWLRVVDTRPVTVSGELPALITVEATAFDYDSVGSYLLTVALDTETTSATVTVRSTRRPTGPETVLKADARSANTVSGERSAPSGTKNILSILAALAILASIGLVGRYASTMPEMPKLALPEVTTLPLFGTSSSDTSGSAVGLDQDALTAVLLGKYRHGLPEERPSGMDPKMYEELADLPEQETYYLEFGVGGELTCLRAGEVTQGHWEIVDPGVVRLGWPSWEAGPPYGLRDGEALYRVISRQASERLYLVDDQDLSLGFWPV